MFCESLFFVKKKNDSRQKRSTRSDFTPPLEVLLTGADGHIVCCLQMNARGNF